VSSKCQSLATLELSSSGKFASGKSSAPLLGPNFPQSSIRNPSHLGEQEAARGETKSLVVVAVVVVVVVRFVVSGSELFIVVGVDLQESFECEPVR